MRIELHYDYSEVPECSYEADVVPRVGELITVVAADRYLQPYKVVQVMHWIKTAPDETALFKSVKLLVDGSFYLLQNAKHTGADNKYLVTIEEGEE